MCMPHVCHVFRPHKRALDSLELALQVVVSCPEWELGTKLVPSARATSLPDFCTISPASGIRNFNEEQFIKDFITERISFSFLSFHTYIKSQGGLSATKI